MEGNVRFVGSCRGLDEGLKSFVVSVCTFLGCFR